MNKQNIINNMVFGIHAIQSLLTNNIENLNIVFISREISFKNNLKSIILKLKKNNIPLQYVSYKWLDNKTGHKVHQGVLALIKSTYQYRENDLLCLLSKLYRPFLLILDKIQDPHNLGACLRSAVASGVDIVIISKRNSAQLNSVAKKVASGAAEIVPVIRVTNILNTVKLLKKKNFWIIGTDSKSVRSIYQISITEAVAVIIGSENSGIRYSVTELCDEIVSIPTSNVFSSLNVSVATGITLFEIAHQRSAIFNS